jgi:glycosyltransferase involved in cell wall biosynthesis
LNTSILLNQSKLNDAGRAPFVSVIIPTYNRAQMVGITLESFFNQNYPTDRYEIIVVDNNSSDNTKQVVDEWGSRAPVPLIYVFEGRQGVHYARNTAFKHSSGDILYYTDDDMIAAPDLLAEIIKPFYFDPRVASVTGRVLPRWAEQPPKWVIDYCFNAMLSLQDRRESLIISPDDCGVYSCHQAMRREAFERSGGFNPENTAGEWIGDGETGLNIKLKELGYLFGFIGSSITYHMIPSSRMTQVYVNKRLANQGNCDSYTAFQRGIYSRPRLALHILFHGARMIWHSIEFLGKFVLGSGSWRISRGKVDYDRSRIRYDFRLMVDEDWRRLVLRKDWLSDV